jgi:hypothetical protein
VNNSSRLLIILLLSCIVPAAQGGFFAYPLAIYKKINQCMPTMNNVLAFSVCQLLIKRTSGGQQGVLSLVNNGSMTIKEADCEALTEHRENVRELPATTLKGYSSRFASVLAQNVIYDYGICRLLSTLPALQLAKTVINHSCDYHWMTMIGATIVEQFVLLWAKKMCTQMILRPVIDGIIRKFPTQEINNEEPVSPADLTQEPAGG